MAAKPFHTTKLYKMDNLTVQELNMLELAEEDQHELTRFCTGEYIKRRAMSVVTAARCYELHKPRLEGRTGTQTHLNEISSEIAQVIG